MKNGKEIDCFYLGSYEAGRGSGSIIASIPGASLYTGTFDTINNAILSKAARTNTEFHLQTIYERHAASLLCLMENGGPNVQTTIGAGNVSDWPTNTGNTNAIWRGIHEMWANDWEWCNGIQNRSGVVHIFDNKGYNEYINTGVSSPGGNFVFPPNQTGISSVSEAKGDGFDLTDVFVPSRTTSDIANSTFKSGVAFEGTTSALLVSGGYKYRSDMCGLFTFGFSIPDSADLSVSARIAKY